MWARNASRDAERAQDDADFETAPGDGGNGPEDERGHVTFRQRAATETAGPNAGDANYHQSITDAIAGLYGGRDDDSTSTEDEGPTRMVEAVTAGGRGRGRGGGRGGGRGRG
jgi:hypothetical protein